MTQERWTANITNSISINIVTMLSTLGPNPSLVFSCSVPCFLTLPTLSHEFPQFLLSSPQTGFPLSCHSPNSAHKYLRRQFQTAYRRLESKSTSAAQSSSNADITGCTKSKNTLSSLIFLTQNCSPAGKVYTQIRRSKKKDTQVIGCCSDTDAIIRLCIFAYSCPTVSKTCHSMMQYNL